MSDSGPNGNHRDAFLALLEKWREPTRDPRLHRPEAPSAIEESMACGKDLSGRLLGYEPHVDDESRDFVDLLESTTAARASAIRERASARLEHALAIERLIEALGCHDSALRSNAASRSLCTPIAAVAARETRALSRTSKAADTTRISRDTEAGTPCRRTR